MPFDTNLYDGIFSHALLHLLNEQEERFIKDCYNQLKPGGYMVLQLFLKGSNVWQKENSWIKIIMR